MLNIKQNENQNKLHMGQRGTMGQKAMHELLVIHTMFKSIYLKFKTRKGKGRGW